MLERGPATAPLFDAFFDAVQQAGLRRSPTTSTAAGRRASRSSTATSTAAAAERGARVPASGDEPAESRGALPHVRRARRLRGHARGRRAGRRRDDPRERGDPLRRRDQLAAAAAALRRRRTPRELEALGVAVVHDLPGVGENLQDHLEVYVQYACTQPVSVQPALKKWKRPLIGAQWLFFRSGPGATNHFEAGGFVRSNDDVAYPNLMFHFLPIAIRYDGTAPPAKHGYQVHVGPMYSDARGSVKITSRRSARAAGAALQLPVDRRRTGASGSRRCASRGAILDQPAFDPYNGGETSPGPSVETDEEILDWVARDAETALHPSCTCRMGTDELSGRRSRDDARARCRRAARRRRVASSRTSRTGTSTRR